MDWTEDAIVLSARPYGESGSIVQLLTPNRGRHAGLVRGGSGSRMRPILQPGNQVRARWGARLADHLGIYQLEPISNRAAEFFTDPDRLATLAAACAVAESALPERESHRRVYDGLVALIEALGGAHWGEAYVGWELGLLAELGFGLQLESCASNGRNDNLIYVSPRTGRAVSAAAGEPYRDKLLKLPGFVAGRGGGGPEEIAQGLELTGYFLQRHVFAALSRPMPAARGRLYERLASTARGIPVESTIG
jgi:DNA repair protein RecO (recombination protein O)